MTPITIEQARQRALEHHRAGRLAEAADAYYNLGNALRKQDLLDEAVAAYRRAVGLNPNLAEAHNNLGDALRRLGRLDEAIAACRRAITLRPDLGEPYNTLGSAYKGKGQLDDAIAAYTRAIALRPDLAEAHSNLGDALWQHGRFDEALAALDQAIRLEPELAEAHNNFGNVLRDQGRIDEALAAYLRAIQAKPGYSSVASNFVYSLYFHPGYNPQRILAEHRKWASNYAEPLAGEIPPHDNDRNPDRRLRIGFLSPDFRAHPVGRLLPPLFAQLDRRSYEIIGYSSVRAPDEVTDRLEALADRWYDVASLDDAQVARQIHADRVDILVDLAVHTGNNRLLVFARKPAPVQVTMLGLPATTGLSTMDFRLTDPYLDPPSVTDGEYTERSIPLPHCFWCYAPPDEAPPVAELPARTNGFITFGCLNQFVKVSRPALRAWIQILRSLPGARLVIHAQPGSHREAVRRLFQEGGVGANRIAFLARVPYSQHFERYHALDLSLDPFTYSGGVTTMDSLWMGVPVITLAGPTAVGRSGVSILSNAGLPELIARSAEEYVAVAIEWAQDLKRLAEIRSGLRERMLASPLMDGVRYAAGVEEALRGMWRRWCSR